MPQFLCRGVAHSSTLIGLQRSLIAALGGPDGDMVRINGPVDDSHRLPNTLSIGIRDICAAKLLAKLSASVAASAGAACHTHDSSKPATISFVLRAMQVPIAFAMGTLRLSVGRHTTEDEVDRAVVHIIASVEAQRSELVLR